MGSQLLLGLPLCPSTPEFQVHVDHASISPLIWKRVQTQPAHLLCMALPCTRGAPCHSHEVGQPLYPPLQAGKQLPRGCRPGVTQRVTRPQSPGPSLHGAASRSPSSAGSR